MKQPLQTSFQLSFIIIFSNRTCALKGDSESLWQREGRKKSCPEGLSITQMLEHPVATETETTSKYTLWERHRACEHREGATQEVKQN